MTYLFRWAGGDCPAGCIENRWWFFSVVNGDATYLGPTGPSSSLNWRLWMESD